MTEEIVVSYLTYQCGEKGSHVEDNRGQGVIPFWKWKELSWCGCKEKTEEKAVRPREVKAQQSGTRSGEPESTAREGGSRKEVWRTFKMLREVWLNIGVEKIDTHEGVVTPQVNFLRKITFDTLYTNEFVIGVRSRALAIPSERTTI